ncbi:hypothetical protein [Flagellimonas pacifica]|uniref:DUF3649 domain-containing protein n=1 Tax=Flagellimonas pacifica TaxID=1247520 RepID=A0A285MIR4_9FLAO|nr:hypothetical protein [Allomuricauda parva]SNY95391.1 hypothetical protein SAMN06265377_1059 [Allomuricauda parva]
MPANPKYLSHSGWHAFAKISAGIFGGYLIAAMFHMALALWLPNHRVVLITSAYSIFLVWTLCLLLPFLSKNGWKVWLIYMAVILILAVAVHYGNLYHPINPKS